MSDVLNILEEDYILNQSQLQKIVKLTHTLSTYTHINDVLNYLSDALENTLPCGKALIWLNAEESTLYTVYKRKFMAAKANETLAGACFLKGTTLHHPKPQKSLLYNKERDSFAENEKVTILLFPLLDQKREPMGVLQIINNYTHPFTPATINVIREFLPILQNTLSTLSAPVAYKHAFHSLTEVISEILDTRDFIASGHHKRVALYAREVAYNMHLSLEETDMIALAAMLHDIGKLAIPELILLSNKKPDENAYKILKQHLYLTYRFLSKIKLPEELSAMATIASAHHEAVDGTGYPRGLEAAEIPLGGKILAVCDVFDSLSSRRNWEDRQPLLAIADILDKGSETAFDGHVLASFKQISLDRIIAIAEHGHTAKIELSDLKLLECITLEDVIEAERGNRTDIGDIAQLFNYYYSRAYRK